MLMFKYKKFFKLIKEIVKKLCDVIVIGVIFANDDEENLFSSDVLN